LPRRGVDKKRKFESKLAELQQLTGFRHCCWKGRQGSWWVAKGFREMITRIANCKSQKFDELVQKCLPPSDYVVALLDRDDN
jgi:hypothetical protein